MQPISRRTFLASSAAVMLAACSNDQQAAPSTTAPSGTAAATTAATPTTAATTTTTTVPQVELPGDPFTLGVSSGDPDVSTVVIWTRLAPDPLNGGGMPGDDVEVAWEISDTDDFATVVNSGRATATPAHGHSVHKVVELAPGTWFYRFLVGDYVSPVGRTIVPEAGVTETRFVTASCQNFEDGYWQAHTDIAAQQPDFVVFLGDFIYEGGAGDVSPESGNVRSHGTPEPTDLVAYRNRYALYRSQPELQASSAACPWMVIWDDHEVENNYASTIPQDPADTAGFAARRAEAYQAWWEHMPVRLDAPTGNADDEYRIYRANRWGELLGIALLDGRQYRDDQACGDVPLNLEPACPEALEPQRTMLGADQEAFVAATVGQQGTAWNVIAQQTVMSSLQLGEAIVNYDQWDGYSAARGRLTADLAARQVPNAVVLTGDIHAAGVGVVRNGAPGEAPIVAVEFVATSISSNGNIPEELEGAVQGFVDIIDAELVHRGYILHTVTTDQWRADYRIVTDAKNPDNPEVTTYQTYVVDNGSTEVRIGGQ
jgi:alkaline phosphatase D